MQVAPDPRSRVWNLGPNRFELEAQLATYLSCELRQQSLSLSFLVHKIGIVSPSRVSHDDEKR